MNEHGAVSGALRRALTDPGPRPLPDEAVRLLTAASAPPRLAAHLRAVHDVAADLIAWVGEHHPAAAADADAVAAYPVEPAA